MTENEIKILTADDFELTATIRIPNENPKAFIQINSGTGIPAKFYTKFARYFAEQGYIVVNYDYRGIGLSKPKSLKGFQCTNLQWGTLDMTAVLNWAIKQYPDLKKIVIGHSMGGQLIGTMTNVDKIDQSILIASGTGFWKDMPQTKLKYLMPILWNFYIPLTTLIYGYGSTKKIRQGENLPKGVVLQWRKWCVSKDYWKTDIEKNQEANNFAILKGKMTSITFSDDNIISDKANEKLLKHYTNVEILKKNISPKEIGLDKLGHFGFFQKKAEVLWQNLI